MAPGKSAMMNEDVWIAIKLEDDSMWRTSCRLQEGVEILGFADEAMIEARHYTRGHQKWDTHLQGCDGPSSASPPSL